MKPAIGYFRRAMSASTAACAFPAADVGVLRAMQTPRGKRPTPSELLARAECWRPWRAYAAAHLWTSLHTQSIAKEQADEISIDEAA